MDMKLEVVVVPVSDVDRAKRFYEKLGVSRTPSFRHDTSGDGTTRVHIKDLAPFTAGPGARGAKVACRTCVRIARAYHATSIRMNLLGKNVRRHQL